MRGDIWTATSAKALVCLTGTLQLLWLCMSEKKKNSTWKKKAFLLLRLSICSVRQVGLRLQAAAWRENSLLQTTDGPLRGFVPMTRHESVDFTNVCRYECMYVCLCGRALTYTH